MWSYNYSSEIRFSDQLSHYGVLGMKWGVRKDASRAYGKAVKKKRKLENKAASKNLKSAELRSKALKKEARATNEKQYQKARKLEFKANKLALQSAKLQRKGLNWVKAMDKTFKNYKVEKGPNGTYTLTQINQDED